MKKIVKPMSLAIILCAIFSLCSCSFFDISIGDLDFILPSQTEYTPNTNADGEMLWPSDLLPEGFPILCDSVDYISTSASSGHDITICVKEPTWDAYYSFVMTLVESGWGSIEDAYIRAYYEERPDSYLGLAEGMRKMYDDESRENSPVFYSGFLGSYHIWCSMDAADSDSDFRFVLYVDQNSNSTHGRFRSTVVPRFADGTLSHLRDWTYSSRNEAYDVFTYKYDTITKYTVSIVEVDAKPEEVVTAYLDGVKDSFDRATFKFTDENGRVGAGATFCVSDASQTLNCAYFVIENDEGDYMQVVLTSSPYTYIAAKKEVETVFGFTLLDNEK